MANKRPRRRKPRTSITVDRDAGTATAVRQADCGDRVLRLNGVRCRVRVGVIDVATRPLPPG